MLLRKIDHSSLDKFMPLGEGICFPSLHKSSLIDTTVLSPDPLTATSLLFDSLQITRQQSPAIGLCLASGAITGFLSSSSPASFSFAAELNDESLTFPSPNFSLTIANASRIFMSHDFSISSPASPILRCISSTGTAASPPQNAVMTWRMTSL
uniref:Uncharacterized protein n=1 Tax=Opuntia streptacantha TaxID=393608 RepID=A0A7C9F0I7_OPUST